MGKQSYVYVKRRKMPDPAAELYTASTSRATLQPDNSFRFDGNPCGMWCYTADALIVINFSAGSNGPGLNHIFKETTTKNCWRLIRSSDTMYQSLEGKAHNNWDTDIVLLIKVPEDIGLDDVTDACNAASDVAI